jgi:hypothetical protein
MNHVRLSLLPGLVLFALVMRVLPYALYQAGMPITPELTWYPWNFSPFMAFCLFAGAAGMQKKSSLLLPMVVLLLSDLAILLLSGDIKFALYGGQPLTYALFAFVTLAGWKLVGRRPGIALALPTAFAAELLFFLISNWAVWQFVADVPYPKTAAGLWTCYEMGLPYFGRSLVSTGLFTLVLFSPLGVIWTRAVPARAAGSELNPALTSATR